MENKKKMYLGLMVIAAVLFGCFLAFASDFGAPTGKNVNVYFKPEVTATVFSASAATGDATSATDFGFTSDKRTCTITTAGTAPTTVTVSLYGSIDNSTSYVQLASHTYTVATADTKMFHVVNKPVRWVKGRYDSKTGGDGTTTVKLDCVAGGN